MNLWNDVVVGQIANMRDVSDILLIADGVSFDKCGLLPQISGVYIVVNQEQNEVLYVGQSIDIRQRWTGHHRHSEILHNWPNSHIVWIECKTMGLDRLERLLIKSLSPKLNSGRISSGIYSDREKQTNLSLDDDVKRSLMKASKITGH